MPYLTVLALLSNEISDLSPLATLTGLEMLGLGHNQISDISPLANLSALLSLNENPITDWAPLNHIMVVEGRPPLPGLVVYALSQDMFIQAQEVGLSGDAGVIFQTNLGWNPFLIQSGSPIFTIEEGPYGNAVRVGERTNNWDALDIGLTQWGDMFVNFEESDYDFYVRGRNASDFPMNIAIAGADGPWNWLTSTEVAPHQEFTLETILSLEAFEATDGGPSQFLERGFRLQTDCANTFVIYEARVTRR
jgi:hypothetical protein